MLRKLYSIFLVPLILLSLFIGCNSKSTILSIDQTEIVLPDNEVMDKMRDSAINSYLQLKILGGSDYGSGCASATKIGEGTAITCFHVLMEGLSTFYNKTELTDNTVLGFKTSKSLLAFKFPDTRKEAGKITIAESVREGEILYSVSNASCDNGVHKLYMAIEVKDDIFYASTLGAVKTEPGESGSGLFNSNGELVGMVCHIMDSGAASVVGPQTIKRFLGSISRNH